MLKREYANYFTTSVNPSTSEVAIAFKQEGIEFIKDPYDKEKKYEQAREMFDVAAVVLTIENARELAELLTNAVSNALSQNQENVNGEPVSDN